MTSPFRQTLLGVACELAVEAGVIPHAERVSDSQAFQYDGQHEHLPGVVRDWLGLRTIIGAYGGDALTCKNDVGSTFEEIADLIESEPEGLFVALFAYGVWP